MVGDVVVFWNWQRVSHATLGKRVFISQGYSIVWLDHGFFEDFFLSKYGILVSATTIPTMHSDVQAPLTNAVLQLTWETTVECGVLFEWPPILGVWIFYTHTFYHLFTFSYMYEHMYVLCSLALPLQWGTQNTCPSSQGSYCPKTLIPFLGRKWNRNDKAEHLALHRWVLRQ